MFDPLVAQCCVLEQDTLTPQGTGPEVIALFLSSAQLSMKFQLLINVEIVEISGKLGLSTQQLVIYPAYKC